MTATDELRRLLDERGVEYDGKTYGGVTFWNDDTNMVVASEDYGGKLRVSQSLTPAQAVEATLGRGECRLVPTRDKPRSKAPTLTCSECGWWTDEIGKAWHYCPNCGTKVVDA